MLADKTKRKIGVTKEEMATAKQFGSTYLNKTIQTAEIDKCLPT